MISHPGEHATGEQPGNVRFALIGQLTVSGRGSETPLRLSPRAQLVLGCLVLAPGMAQRREALASAIWGDRIPDSRRASLRNAVAEARAALRAAFPDDRMSISSSGGVYRVMATGTALIEVDVLAARAATKALPSCELDAPLDVLVVQALMCRAELTACASVPRLPSRSTRGEAWHVYPRVRLGASFS